MPSAPHWNNERLRALGANSRGSSGDVARIAEELERQGTLTQRALETGLFPAALVDATAGSGYERVWVRDNAFVAYAHVVHGQPLVAVKVAGSMMEFFQKSGPGSRPSSRARSIRTT